MRARVTAAVVAVFALRGLLACVDGVTPDCTNAAVCSPIEGDAGPLGDSAVPVDAHEADAAPDVQTADVVDAADGG